ncbi:hypothetical protein [Reyranella massiliensis]|uniref:hypothetical protein n=1 Tax=Reyranella massiliensis TaxID=445220 RepID=UPI0005C284A2|nr:hypothetical protein [Reyranella massiliensis]
MTTSDDRNETFLKGPLLQQGQRYDESLESYNKDWRLGGQIYGYQRAAETLIQHVLEHGAYSGRTFLHPILYLHRHSIELRLKRLVSTYGGEWPKTQHSIAKVWTKAKEVIDQNLAIACDDLERLLFELDQIDPDGQTFRYTSNRQGEPINIPIAEVDIRHFQNKMEEIDIALSGLEDMLEQAITAKWEASR